MSLYSNGAETLLGIQQRKWNFIENPILA
ncbi:Protein of unknown function [Bacillus cereus]|nr:Protein of unknown function [Bacillus cereus]